MSALQSSPTPYQAPAAACAEHKLSLPPAASPNKGDVPTMQTARRVQRAQWLRAAILGANDGLLSTTALMLGVSATNEERWSVILSGLAGTMAGACSMGVGEFVSVATQRDIEKANRKLNSNLEGEFNITNKALPQSSASPTLKTMTGEVNCNGATRELPESPALATTLASRMSTASSRQSLMMPAIAEEERTQRKEATDNGEEVLPNPYKAAVASSFSFVLGSAVPLVLVMLVRDSRIRNVVLPAGATIALAIFGGLGAYLGGSPVRISALRVIIGGCIAMAITYGLMKPFHKNEE